MKYVDFTKEVNELMEGVTVDYIVVNRMLGLCYGQYMYKKSMSNLMKEYELEEVLSALRNGKEFVENIQDYQSDLHKINSYIKATKRNLSIYNYDEIDPEIPDDFEL